MKKLLLVSSILVVSGCSTLDEQAITKEDQEVRIDNLAKHAERAYLNKTAFCDRSELYSYNETENYYFWRCKDGSNFMVRKNK